MVLGSSPACDYSFGFHLPPLLSRYLGPLVSKAYVVPGSFLISHLNPEVLSKWGVIPPQLLWGLWTQALQGHDWGHAGPVVNHL